MVEPTNAKYLGFIHAKGKYISFIDHDEVLLNPNSILDKVRILEQNSKVNVAITSGYRNPPNPSPINKYINEFGDPFSFFIYRFTKHSDFFFPIMHKRYKCIEDNSTYAIFDISSSSHIPIFELGAGAGIINKSIIQRQYGSTIRKYQYIPTELSSHYPSQHYVAIIKNDPVLHYSSENIRGYTNKIIWRIKNNLFYSETTDTPAYKNRITRQSRLFQFKKYLYLPYAFTLIGPMIDTFFLMISRKDISYIIHVPVTIITSILIVYYYILKLFGLKLSVTCYDGSLVVYEKK